MDSLDRDVWRTIVSLVAFYVAGVVCAWVWAPWWAALTISGHLIWAAIEVAVAAATVEWDCRRRSR